MARLLPQIGLLSERILTPAEIFGSNLFDDWDFGDLASITESSGLISQINSLTGSGRNFTFGSGFEPTLVSNQINGYSVARFDGVSEYGEVASSTSLYKFLHNGSGGVVFGIVKPDAGITTQQAILSNVGGSTSTTGHIVSVIDDGSTYIDRIIMSVRNGSGTALNSSNAQSNAYTNGQFNSFMNVFDSDNATAADRIKSYVNSGSLIAINTLTNSASASNASYNLTLGKLAGASALYFGGEVARIIIVNTIPTATQLYYFNKWVKYYYGNLPVT